MHDEHVDPLTRCVGDPDEFEAHCWGRRPLLRRSDPGFDDVFSVAALDDFLASGVRRPLVRLVRDGTPIPGEHYTRTLRLGGRDVHDVVDPDLVSRKFSAGATVVAQSLHRTHPDVSAFVAGLGDQISHPLQANAYLTPTGAVGLAPHADSHDVFVLQLAGTKRWKVDELGERCLEPGDCLYVPAGTKHSAASTERSSLHLTIGVLRITYRSVLQRALRRAPSVLDRPLPLRFGTEPASFEAELTQMIDDVRTHLAAIDVAALEASERSRTLARPPRPGALAAAVDAANIGASDVIVRCGAPWTIDVAAGVSVEVRGDERRLIAPASCEQAIEQLATGERVRVSKLAGVDLDSRAILARRLVAEGLCAVADETGAPNDE